MRRSPATRGQTWIKNMYFLEHSGYNSSQQSGLIKKMSGDDLLLSFGEENRVGHFEHSTSIYVLTQKQDPGNAGTVRSLTSLTIYGRAPIFAGTPTSQMGLSENSVPLHPMVLLIIIPIKWLFHWGYTPFSDIPKYERPPSPKHQEIQYSTRVLL